MHRGFHIPFLPELWCRKAVEYSHFPLSLANQHSSNPIHELNMLMISFNYNLFIFLISKLKPLMPSNNFNDNITKVNCDCELYTTQSVMP